MDDKFYDVANELDKLKKVEKPSDEDFDKLSKFLDGVEYIRYFFHDLNNPGWIIPIHENGWFYKVPDPLVDENQPGYYIMPIWHEGEYLKRMASQFPEVVKDVALNLDTENSRAVRTMLEALSEIPVNTLAEVIDEFKTWLNTPFASSMMISHELGHIMEYLAEGGQIEASLKILNILSEPVVLKDRFEEERLIAGTQHDFFWLNRTFEVNLSVLIEINPISVVRVFEQNLVEAINLEYGSNIDDQTRQLNNFWRLNISPRSDLNYRRDFKDLLVNKIILALDKASEQKKDGVSDILKEYIDSEYTIFRRIAVYILRKWGKQYIDLLEKAYINHIKEPIRVGKSEFNRFIEDQFINLPKYIQEKELKDIRQSSNKEWQLHKLDQIAPYLEGEDKELYEKLLKEYGKPLQRPEVGVVTSWKGPETPISIDELSNKGVEEVIKYLIDYIPPNEVFAPSREGLGRTFEEDVQTRTKEYAENSLLFINVELPFVYHTHFFKGLENSIKNKDLFPLEDVISLCEHVINLRRDKFTKNEHEPGLQEAKLAIARLIYELLRMKESNIIGDLINVIGKIIVELLDQEDPYLIDEDKSDFDPATRSLNSTRGIAMHCIILYGLQHDRIRKEKLGDKHQPVMDPLVKETITEKLDKSKDPSLAVHSVMGWYFPQLIYLDKEWALKSRKRIFPLESNLSNYWQAAWSAYIRFSDVYTDVFPELINHYRKALEDINIFDKEQGWDRTDERLATHILKSYILDLIKLGSEDNLIVLYYKKADDKTRSHGTFWLSQVLEAQKPSADTELWRKIWNLWKWRLEEAISSKDRSDYNQEITNYYRLLKNVPLGLKEMYSVLQQTLEFNANDYELHLVIDYLGKNCDQYPNLAVSILHDIVLSGQSFFMTKDTRYNVEKIFKAVLGADRKVKNKAIEIINIFGERGDYEWRPFLDKLKEL